MSPEEGQGQPTPSEDAPGSPRFQLETAQTDDPQHQAGGTGLPSAPHTVPQEYMLTHAGFRHLGLLLGIEVHRPQHFFIVTVENNAI